MRQPFWWTQVREREREVCACLCTWETESMNNGSCYAVNTYSKMTGGLNGSTGKLSYHRYMWPQSPASSDRWLPAPTCRACVRQSCMSSVQQAYTDHTARRQLFAGLIQANPAPVRIQYIISVNDNETGLVEGGCPLFFHLLGLWLRVMDCNCTRVCLVFIRVMSMSVVADGLCWCHGLVKTVPAA